MRFIIYSIFLAVLFSVSFSGSATDQLKVVLVGDSTTIGNTPRVINPEGPHLEQLIEQLAELEGLPKLTVINTGKGGETAKRLLDSGWYDDKIAPLSDVDYIFVRLGINDWFKLKNLAVDFPLHLKTLITRLRKDHPQARIIMSSIIRFGDHAKCVDINHLIAQVAREEKLDFFDVYTPYNAFLQANGENSLNVRKIPLAKIPAKYHQWLKPYSYWRKGYNGKPDGYQVMVDDLTLDPILGDVKEWYYDRHPNSTGYHLIATETVKYLAPLLKANNLKKKS